MDCPVRVQLGYLLPCRAFGKIRRATLFELTANKGKWGDYIKINGRQPGSGSMMEELGPDGYKVRADNNGTVVVWKNGKWNEVVKNDKNKANAYLKSIGYNGYLRMSGLRGFRGVSGLGNPAYALT